MKRYGKSVAIAGAVALAAVGHGAAARLHAQAANTGGVRYEVAAEGNEARYRVREQLAGVDFPNDAVGKTAGVTGALVLDDKGAVVAGQSEFVIDLATLVSDQDRRDNFLRRNTLTTEQYPKAKFVPQSARGLPAQLPANGDLTFQLAGDLTIKDVTKPVVWDVTAKVANGVVTGLAQTKFTFAEFNLTKPRLARVLSVDDDIRLEYEFRLEPKK